MPQVHINETVKSSHGEVVVHLNINLNLTMENGKLQISTQDDKVMLEIPDIDTVSQNDLIEFGKEV